VHSNRGIARPDRLAGYSLRRRKTYWVHSVGASKSQADAVAEKGDRAAPRLDPRRRRVVVRTDHHEASEPVQKDDSAAPVLYYGVDQFDFYTTPTSR
jgi:hypothetical protein